MSALAIKNNVTIVIPCRNEINYIGQTIHYINAQHNIRGTRIITNRLNLTC